MKLTFTTIFLLFGVFLAGQVQEEVIAKFHDEKVQLKISIPDYPRWVQFMENGWHVERRTNNQAFRSVTNVPIKPDLENNSKISDLNAELSQYIDSLKNDPANFEKAQKSKLYLLKILTLKSKRQLKNSGLYWEDNEVQEGETYTYRVYPVDQPEASLEVTLKATETYQEVPQIRTKQTNETIRFKFNNSGFETFLLEKGSAADRLSDEPYFFMSTLSKYAPEELLYVDSLNPAFKTYYYRISGIDAFANRYPGKVIKIQIKDVMPPAKPTGLTYEDVNEQAVKLSWDQLSDPDASGYLLYRSDFPDSAFQRINKEPIPLTRSNFLDTISDNPNFKYYKVSAVDAAGNEAYSNSIYVALNTKTPPSPPTDLDGKINLQGIVDLSWSASKAEDLKGYIINRSVADTVGFTRLNSKIERKTTFTDTLYLNIQDEFFYYEVRAVDKHFNYSRPALVKIKLPDTIAPTAPVIRSAKIEGNQISLSWEVGREKDITKIMVLHNSDTTGNWNIIAEINDTSTRQIAIAIPEGQRHFLALRTMDDAKNSSDVSNVKMLYEKSSQQPDGVRNIKAKVKKDGEVTISWDAPLSKQVFRYLVFRNSKNEELQLLESTEETSYTEFNLSPGVYTYFVIAQNAEGRKSKPSEEVTAEIE